jgi:hypothetical protein
MKNSSQDSIRILFGLDRNVKIKAKKINIIY